MNAGEGGPRRRLLVLASTFPRWVGDPEPGFVHALARRLASRFDVTVLCPHAPGAATRDTMDGVHVVRYRYAPAAFESLVNDGGIVANLRRSPAKCLLVPGFVLAQCVAAWRLVRSGKVDVIHAHWILPQGLVAMLAARARGGRAVPVLVTSHGGDLFALRGRVARWLKRWTVARAAMTTVVSEGMRAPMLALGADPSTLRVEPMGVDLSGRFTVDPDVQRARDEVLFVGRLVEKKGLRHLIDAMPHILEARPAAFLTVVGFGPELEARRRQVEGLGLSDRVRFAGAVGQDALPAHYRRAAVFVAPFVEAAGGDQDGLGLVLVEALGCGCPVVVSTLPATEALAARCHAVEVVAPGDPRLLARAVLDSLASDARPRPEEIASFDWQARADAYARHLDALGDRR